jgi:hypothetical protein
MIYLEYSGRLMWSDNLVIRVPGVFYLIACVYRILFGRKGLGWWRKWLGQVEGERWE